MHNDSDIGTKARVLVVDDSKSIREYVNKILVKAGHTVTTAADGRTCLDCIKTDEPDVILLDIEMPELSGLEVLDALHPHKRIHSIILLTSLSKIEDVIAGLDRGGDDYITKPFNDGELLARVSAAVRTTNLKKQLVKVGDSAEEALRKFRETHNRLIEEQKISAIAKLASGMSHEINNPLGFIKSNLGTLIEYTGTLTEGTNRFVDISKKIKDRDSELDRTVAETLDWLKKSNVAFINKDIEPLILETQEGIDRIASILDCLLTMDRAAYCSEDEIIDFNNIVRSFENSCILKLPSEVSLAVDLADTPLNINGKTFQLQMAAENILKNAVEAAGEEGMIKVITFIDNEWACINIRDSGAGIPQENLQSIFEPFYTTKYSHERVGLGLTVAQYFISAHRGRIDIHSVVGEGTSVTIRIPLEQCQTEEYKRGLV